MTDANSPLKQSRSDARKAAIEQFKLLFLQIFRWTKGFLEAQKLPLVANRACEVYVDKANKAHQTKCRRLLQTRLELNPAQLSRFLHTRMGDDLLAWFERFFHLPGDREKKHALRQLILEMAADPEGLSILSVLRRYPQTIQLNVDQLLLTAKRVELLLQETSTIIASVRECAIAEAVAEIAQNGDVDFASLPDLRQPGPFAVKQFTLVLPTSQRDCLPGQVYQRQLTVTCYQPDPFPGDRVPVIVQSHGLASSPVDLQNYAIHLASYGYFVAAPQHPGSDTDQVFNMLAGAAADVFKLAEFVDRPLDISHVLDELERRNDSEFGNNLDLQTVGVMGYSFGAYTAFALAGAEIQFDKLEIACSPAIAHPNLSLLLQCQALNLPRQRYHLHDGRVRAILSIDSVGSEVFGPQGIAKIQIPVLLVAGSHDAAAPLAFEQIRLFHWLTAPQSYLALMQGRAHVQDIGRLVESLNLQIKVSPRFTFSPDVIPFEEYIKALSLAFFHRQLMPQIQPLPRLNAAYARYLSQSPFDLWLISQASNQALTNQLQMLNSSSMTTPSGFESARREL